MKRLICAFLTLLIAASVLTAAQSTNSPDVAAKQENKTRKPAVKRGPVFRSTKEQIKQAQALLRTRGFYAGTDSGKLDADTRAALKKYQEAEGLKTTGTLNKATLERMGVVLNDRQKEWKPAT